MQQRSVSRICDTGYIPLPRSLTRCARSFDCGERSLLAQKRQYGYPQNQGIRPERTCEQKGKARTKGRAAGVFP